MKGDFSRWHYRRADNFQGVLPQQGRVLLDSDGTAQTRMVMDWQDLAASDVIGDGVAAVPAARPASFKIDAARVDAGQVLLTVEPGRVWADGRLVHLPGATPVEREATYLAPPVQNPQATVGSIAAGVRDAVVLEVWREAINGFQMPDLLIEPALGGPDTAERVFTSAAFRLFRMGPGDTCGSIAIGDDFSKKGKLTATLQPTVTVPGDCPLVESGGYTGFEHHLYRVEIADMPAASPPMFKWSRFNGGLVGRGIFDGATLRANITANLAAINTCGLTAFYLEAEEFNASRGIWEVTYGAQATLNNNNQLVLSPSATFGAIPSSPSPPTDPKTVFFRLWDGLKPVSAFVARAELEDGIFLQFDPPAAGNYSPRDYWTFQVRAGGIANPDLLIDAQPPEGIHHHRVPLGVITWNAALTASADAGEISDCRDPFPPLTRTSSCCTYRVGDGKQSHGDFTSIQKAINALPADGGEICILPGTYAEAVLIRDRRNIRLHGCGPRSRIIAPPPVEEFSTPIALHVQDSRGIHIDSLAVEAHPAAPAILLDSTDLDSAVLIPGGRIPKLHDIHLTSLRVTAQARSAIEARGGQFIEILRCDIRMLDVPGSWPGIFFLGDDALIAKNQVHGRSSKQQDDDVSWPIAVGTTLGGIQIGGSSERVRIIDNLIQGGIGNGITLGGMKVIDANGSEVGPVVGWVVNPDDPCSPCKPGSTLYPPGEVGGGDGTQLVSAGPLTQIRIERNRIYDMGLNGIGVVAFFDLRGKSEAITVQGLEILGNEIRRCLRRQIEDIPAALLNRIGYGGIALADVDDLVVWDNVIEDNGPRRTDPVCGIFVLLSHGADISRNRICNNGAATAEPVTSAKPGQRGGIVIIAANYPLASAVNSAAAAFQSPQIDRPALRVHDNVVVAPLGRALSVTALGSVSVVGNLLATQAVMPVKQGSFDGFLVSAVYILNLGRSVELAGQLSGFQGLRRGEIQSSNVSAAPSATATAAARSVGDGRVLFSNNQVTLDVTEKGTTFAATAITIATLDDVQFTDNQSQLLLQDDFVLAHTYLFGFSLRALSNRWQEPLLNTLYSAITLGLMNVTSDNVATHCIVAMGPARLLVKDPNVILLSLLPQNDPCAGLARILTGFGTAAGG